MKLVEYSSSEREEDVVCIPDDDTDLEELGTFPHDGGTVSEDVMGEIWIKYVVWSMWAHVECAGADKEDYMCDFCKLKHFLKQLF